MMTRIPGALKLLLAITLAVTACSVSVGWVLANNTVFGFDSPGVSTWTRWPQIVGMAALMVLGCLASAVWNSIPCASSEGPPPRVNIKRAFAFAINSPSFLRSIIVSPIIFGAVYAASRSETDSVVVYLLAFQNGFFWDAIFQSRRPQGGTDD